MASEKATIASPILRDPYDMRQSSSITLVSHLLWRSVLVMLVVAVIGCGILCGAQAGRFRLQVGDQVGGVDLGNPQGGHVHARVLRRERKGDG